MSVFTALNKLKTNIFGGPGNTGFTKPPASRVQDIGIQPSPTGLLNYDPLSVSTFSYPLDVQNNFQNGQNPKKNTFFRINIRFSIEKFIFPFGKTTFFYRNSYCLYNKLNFSWVFSIV